VKYSILGCDSVLRRTTEGHISVASIKEIKGIDFENWMWRCVLQSSRSEQVHFFLSLLYDGT